MLRVDPFTDSFRYSTPTLVHFYFIRSKICLIFHLQLHMERFETDSTPDIFLCGSNWSAKTSWRLAEPIGSSDHLPIIIELNHKICYKPNGVDWSSFTNKVESKMSNLPNEPNLSLRVSRFNDILIFAATTHVGKSKPSRRSNDPSKSPGVDRRLS